MSRLLRYLILLIGAFILLVQITSYSAMVTQSVNHPSMEEPLLLVNRDIAVFKKYQTYSNMFCERLGNVIQDDNVYAHQGTFNIGQNTLNFTMHVVNSKDDKGDIVSHHIRYRNGWEIHLLARAFDYLEYYRSKRGLQREQVTFVDIGANIGWYSRVMAELGYNVLSFEPMPQNELIIRKNQCEFFKKNAKNTWTYLPFGLGDHQNRCEIYSPPNNQGNGNVFCDKSSIPSNYIFKSTVDIHLLDDLFSQSFLKFLNIGFIKMDVESFEIFVIRGGQNLFKTVDLMQFETNTQQGTMSQAQELWKALHDLGFTISLLPYGDPTEIANGKVTDCYAYRSQ